MSTFQSDLELVRAIRSIFQGSKDSTAASAASSVDGEDIGTEEVDGPQTRRKRRRKTPAKKRHHQQTLQPIERETCLDKAKFMKFVKDKGKKIKDSKRKKCGGQTWDRRSCVVAGVYVAANARGKEVLIIKSKSTYCIV